MIREKKLLCNVRPGNLSPIVPFKLTMTAESMRFRSETIKSIERHLIFYISALTIIVSLSCSHNRLKTNEKKLINEIGAQEKEKKKTENISHDKQKTETPVSFKTSIRYKENREVDPNNPPLELDILGTVNNIHLLRLSDIASLIRYVKLQTPHDTSMLYEPFYKREDLMSTFTSDGEQIIFQGLYGLTRFNMSGEYKETIWKNQTGIEFYGGAVMLGRDFFGVSPQIPVTLSEGNLFFRFQDGYNGKSMIMKYRPKFVKNIFFESPPEVHAFKAIPGDTLFKTNSIFEGGFDRVYGAGQNMWAGVNNKWNAGGSGASLVTYNSSGDTICKFSDYGRIENFSKSEWRDLSGLDSYYYEGLLTIKPEYNDTLFRLIPPNRLLPVYIIDFGEYKVNYMDGLNPDFDLSEKYILHSLHETKDYLFIRYTQNYDCTVAREKDKVKFYNAIFYKKERKLYHQPGFTFTPEGITNDLDGGMPFWPDFISPRGDMMKLVSGKIIKDYVNSEAFTKGTMSPDQRKKQISLATGLKDRDMVIIIVK